MQILGGPKIKEACLSDRKSEFPAITVEDVVLIAHFELYIVSTLWIHL